mmetsp:Transcript_22377/g.70091  ORF Transcript_22377/g.70091 Transcript_22377/m.70091 type:complete len:110 (-) Transcript_22377:301-630(-)
MTLWSMTWPWSNTPLELVILLSVNSFMLTMPLETSLFITGVLPLAICARPLSNRSILILVTKCRYTLIALWLVMCLLSQSFLCPTFSLILSLSLRNARCRLTLSRNYFA